MLLKPVWGTILLLWLFANRAALSWSLNSTVAFSFQLAITDRKKYVYIISDHAFRAKKQTFIWWSGSENTRLKKLNQKLWPFVELFLKVFRESWTESSFTYQHVGSFSPSGRESWFINFIFTSAGFCRLCCSVPNHFQEHRQPQTERKQIKD